MPSDNAVLSFGKDIKVLTVDIKELASVFRPLIITTKEQEKAGENLAVALAVQFTKTKELTKANITAEKFTELLRRANEALTNDVKELAGAMDIVLIKEKRSAATKEKAITLQKKATIKVREMKAEMLALNASVGAALVPLTGYNKALKGNEAAMSKFTLAVKENKRRIREKIQADKEATATTNKANIAAKKARLEWLKNSARVRELNVQLKVHNTTLKNTAIDQKLVKAAMKGSEVAYRQLRIQVRGLNTEMAQQHKANVLGLGSSRLLNNAFATLRSKILLASFAVTVMTRTLFKFITKSSEFNETVNRMNVLFEDNSKGMQVWATKLAKSMNISKNSTFEMTANIFSLFDSMGFAEKRAISMSKTMVQLSLDVASFFPGVTDTQVMNNFTSALVGNHEAIRKYNIIITDTMLKTEALRQGIRLTNGELTAQQKIQLRLDLILKSTTKAQGDRARTLEEFENVLRSFNENLITTMTELGDILLPTTRLLTKFATTIIDTDRLQGYTLAIGSLVLAIGYLSAATKIAAIRVAVLKEGLKVYTATTWAAVKATRAFRVASGIIFAEGLVQAVKWINRYGDGLIDIINTTAKAKDFTKEWRAEQERLNEELAITAESLLDFQVALDRALLGSLSGADAITEKYRLKLIKLNKTLEDSGLTPAEIVKQYEIMYQRFKDAEEKDITSFIQGQRDKANAIRQGISVKQLELSLYNNTDKRILSQLKENIRWINTKRDIEKLEADLRPAEIKKLIDANDKLHKSMLGNIDLTHEQSTLEQSLELYKTWGDGVIAIIDQVHARKEASIQNNMNRELDALRATGAFQRSSDKRKKAEEQKIKDEAYKSLVKLHKAKQAMSIAEIAMNLAVTLTKNPAITGTLFAIPANKAALLQAAFSTALVLAQPKPQKFAKGGEFTTSGAENITVGEKGREHVRITPIDRPDSRSLSGGDVHITFSGNVLSDDFIEFDAIPKIKRAIRRGADIGIA